MNTAVMRGDINLVFTGYAETLEGLTIQPTQGHAPEELEANVRAEVAKYKEVIDATGQRGEF